MGKISYVEFDGHKVSSGGTVRNIWAKWHSLTIYYDCEAWFTDCTCKFVVKVDGRVEAVAEDIVVPTEGGAHPAVNVVLGELKPGTHNITVESYERAPKYEDLTDRVTLIAEISKKDEDQTSPVDNPEFPSVWGIQFGEIPWWAWLCIGILGVAVAYKAIFPSPTEKLKELMELKLMKELAEEEE